MSGNLRLNGATSGYSELAAPDVAGDQTFTFPATGGVLGLAGGLRIEQIVNNLTNTGEATTSTNYVDTKLGAVITPKSTSNKVLVIVNQTLSPVSSGTNGFAKLRILRGTTTILSDARVSFVVQHDHHTYSYTVLDSPTTNVAVQYKTQMATSTSSYTLEAQHAGLRTSCITLIELSGF